MEKPYSVITYLGNYETAQAAKIVIKNCDPFTVVWEFKLKVISKQQRVNKTGRLPSAAVLADLRLPERAPELRGGRGDPLGERRRLAPSRHLPDWRPS